MYSQKAYSYLAGLVLLFCFILCSNKVFAQCVGAPLVGGVAIGGNTVAQSRTPVWTRCYAFSASDPPSARALSVSVNANNTLTDYTIIWGDGKPNTTGPSLIAGSSLNHIYDSLGQYTVRIISDVGGCIDTVYGTVNNISPPRTSIKPLATDPKGCAPLSITFSDTTNFAFPGTILTWNFGDGTTVTRGADSANMPITHTWISGSITQCTTEVRLTASNNNCAAAPSFYTIGPVTLKDKDEAEIGLPNLPYCAANRTYTFTDNSTVNCPPEHLFRYIYWDFGDGTDTGWIYDKFGGSSITHTFPDTGTYVITLKDSNDCGVDIDQRIITINIPPQAAFTANPKAGCAPLMVNFTDESLGILTARVWSFTGTTPTNAADANPTRTFSTPGSYIVQLSVANACGNSGPVRDTINVYVRPVPLIGGLRNGCAPHSVILRDSTQNISPNATYFWDLGNGDTSTAKNPATFTYTVAGTYNVKLVITDTCGVDSVIRQIRVDSVPTAQFTATTVCKFDSTEFDASTSVFNVGDNPLTYKWYYGIAPIDSSTTGVSPKFRYNNAGHTYRAILKVTTNKGCVDFDTQTVTVKVSPNLVINNTPTSICDGDVMSFTGDTSGSINNIISFQWTFGGTTTDTARGKDTAYVFPDTGIYVVRFSAVNDIGCPNTVTKSVTVNPLPDARPTSGVVCFGQFTQFRDSSTVGSGNTIVKQYWDFNDDGTIDDSTQHPLFKFPTDGTHRVLLQVKTNNNCSNTDSIDVTVNPVPVPAIARDTGSLCKQDSFTFTNTTTGAANYLWNFGESAADTLTTITLDPLRKAYADSGTYTVKMIAATALGCTDSASFTVISRPLPLAVFTVNDTIGCAPKDFQFTNASLMADYYLWQINGVNNSTAINRPDTIVAQAAQTILVTLIATNNFGCRPDTANHVLRTFSNPVPDFTMSADSGCGPLDVIFTNPTVATSFQWSLGNGVTSIATNPSTTYLASALNDSVYTVKLIASNGSGCSDSISKTVTVFPKPASSFTQDKTADCSPLELNFTNTSVHKFGGTIDSLTFDWSFGNGNSSVQKDTAQTYLASAIQDTIYNIQLIVTSKFGCQDTASSSVRVYPNARANFSISQQDGCAPLAVNFNNTSIPNDTGNISIMSFNWDFANGNTSTILTPLQQTFIASPVKDTVYNVRLIAFSEHNCADTTYREIRIYPKPLSQFTATDTAGCGPLNITFNNSSTPFDTGSIADMTFLWDFGNGFNSIATHPGSQYFSIPLADTTYTVKLIATSEHGCKDTSQRTITVHPTPVVGFTQDKTQGCGPLTIQYTNTSQLAAVYHWIFGDGDTSASVHPAHTFASYPLFDTIYNTKLVVRSAFGCVSDTASANVIARYSPVAAFMSSNDSICGDGNIAFYNTSIGVISNQWNFGNGQTSSNINPVANFVSRLLEDTTYDVRLIVTSPYQCKDTTLQTVTVNYLPDAKFTSVTSGCTPLNVAFVNQSVKGVRYEWDFGDATTDTTTSPAKLFENNVTLVNRIYPVTVTAYSISGCIDTAKTSITVYPKPISDFSFVKDNRCDTAAYHFSNATQGASSYEWQFEAHASTNTPSPTTYFTTAPGNDVSYDVKLISTTNFGCKDSITKSITVRPLVKAEFITDQTSSCANLNVNFTNQSANAVSYFWIFGDGSGSPLTNPNKQYQNTGTYTVQLIAYDSYGCSDTAVKANHIQVYEVPQADFLYTPFAAAMPDAEIQFNDLSVSTEGTLTHQWNFGDTNAAINQSTAQNPAHVYSDSGNYTVRLIVRSVNNCYDTTTQTLRIYPHPPIADFDFGPIEGCRPLTVTFNNKSQYAGSYKWFIDGKILEDENPVYTFVAPRTYSVTLQATGVGGINFKTVSDSIIVHDLPRPNFVVTPLQLVLPNATVTLTDISYDAEKWEWSVFNDNGNVFKSLAHHAEYNFLTDGEYSIKLVAENQFGCRDSITHDRVVEVFTEGKITVPTAFTPNGDGVNETFKPVFSGVLNHGYSFRIYNRWGQKVFETNDVNGAWDGNIMGGSAGTDVYIWKVEGYMNGGVGFSKDGTVTLLR